MRSESSRPLALRNDRLRTNVGSLPADTTRELIRLNGLSDLVARKAKSGAGHATQFTRMVKVQVEFSQSKDCVVK